MAGPYDYNIQQPDITGSLLGGIASGQQISAQRAAQDKAMLFQSDLQGYLQNPTARGASELIAKYPEARESLSASYDTFDKAQKEDILKVGTQAYLAIQNKRPDIALGLLDKRIEAAKNSGQSTTDLESLKTSIQQNPDGAAAGLALTMSSFNPDAWSKVGTEQRASDLAPYEKGKARAESGIKQVEARYAPEREFLESSQSRANTRNLYSQIADRAGRLNLDEDRLQSDIEAKVMELGQKATTLDDGAKKIVNDAVVASVAADQAAGQFLDLASQIDKLGGGYGAFGTAAEFWANATGQQDAMSAARREYVRLRNTQAVKNLPPGAASDADVAMALEGFPKETADSKTLSAFLRGTAKLSQIEATNENAKAEWANAVGYLGKPKRDIEIDGVQVPAGTTFTDFAKKYIGAKTEQRGAQQSQQQVPKRSYMRFATPGGQ